MSWWDIVKLVFVAASCILGLSFIFFCMHGDYKSTNFYYVVNGRGDKLKKSVYLYLGAAFLSFFSILNLGINHFINNEDSMVLSCIASLGIVVHLIFFRELKNERFMLKRESARLIEECDNYKNNIVLLNKTIEEKKLTITDFKKEISELIELMNRNTEHEFEMRSMLIQQIGELKKTATPIKNED